MAATPDIPSSSESSEDDPEDALTFEPITLEPDTPNVGITGPGAIHIPAGGAAGGTATRVGAYDAGVPPTPEPDESVAESVDDAEEQSIEPGTLPKRPDPDAA